MDCKAFTTDPNNLQKPYWLDVLHVWPTATAANTQPDGYTCLGGWSACLDKTDAAKDHQALKFCAAEYQYCPISREG